MPTELTTVTLPIRQVAATMDIDTPIPEEFIRDWERLTNEWNRMRLLIALHIEAMDDGILLSPGSVDVVCETDLTMATRRAVATGRGVLVGRFPTPPPTAHDITLLADPT